MYVPTFNSMRDDAERRAFVRAHRVGQLVTVGLDGAPDATLLPLLWEGDRVIAHLARNNPQWERITAGGPGLVVISGPDAYISPSWYASKREHGRVVPTWNDSAVHLSGPVRVVDDPEWVLEAVTRLTERHEGGRRDTWQVTDAPTKFVAGRLRAIVGVELTVTSVEGKDKLSQNRSDADRRGAVEGLRADANRAGEPTARQLADLEVADRMGDALEVDDRR